MQREFVTYFIIFGRRAFSILKCVDLGILVFSVALPL